MTETQTDSQRIDALKAARTAQAHEEAELSLPRLTRIAELLTARRENTAELERLAVEVPLTNAETLLGLLTQATLSRSESQALSLLANAVQVMRAECEAKLAAAEDKA